jgi:hypothetical protein
VPLSIKKALICKKKCYKAQIVNKVNLIPLPKKGKWVKKGFKKGKKGLKG